MASGHVTKRSVDALAPSGKDLFLWDVSLKGFGVKVTPANRRVYLFQYRVKGKSAPVRITIGEHGGFDIQGKPWTPDRARTEAEKLRGLVSSGIDPVGNAKSEAAAQAERELQSQREAVMRTELTVQNMSQRWLDDRKHAKPRTWRFYEPNVRLHIVPHIGDKSMHEVTKSDLYAMLGKLPADQIALRRSVFSTARAFWKWTAKHIDLPEVSPFDNFNAPKVPDSRARFLDNTELVTVWQAAQKLAFPFREFFSLLILTGQRRNEVAGIKWEELNQDRQEWVIPAERCKNGKPNIVPLNCMATGLLDRFAVNSKWPANGLFLTTNGKSAISGFSRAKRLLDDKIAEILTEADLPAFADWRVHDLRRTVATNFQKLGIQREVTEAVLNHISGTKSGVEGIYGRHDWAPEKISALRTWGEHLQHLLNPTSAKNVVTIRPRSKSG